MGRKTGKRSRMTNMVSALFVQTNGCYFGLQDVDPWDEKRDARNYLAPFPVVAHPPCQRWGKMWFGQPLAISKGAPKQKLGDDGGLFRMALNIVRANGGVIEHPKGSHAWKYYGLPIPKSEGGWSESDGHGGRSCCVEQGRYGHYARKPTWLYAVGIDFIELDWGVSEPRYDPVVVARMGLKRAKRLGEVGAKGGGKNSKPRIATPIPFRDLLLAMARSANSQENWIVRQMKEARQSFLETPAYLYHGSTLEAIKAEADNQAKG